MYRHILIATDGSERASKGVQHGLALAGVLHWLLPAGDEAAP